MSDRTYGIYVGNDADVTRLVKIMIDAERRSQEEACTGGKFTFRVDASEPQFCPAALTDPSIDHCSVAMPNVFKASSSMLYTVLSGHVGGGI